MNHISKITMLYMALTLITTCFLFGCKDQLSEIEDQSLLIMDGSLSNDVLITAEVTLSDTYHLEEALIAEKGSETWTSVQKLTIKGSFYGKDVATLHQLSVLQEIDMSNAQFVRAEMEELDAIAFSFVNESGETTVVSEQAYFNNMVFHYSFAGMAKLKKVIMPETVTKIGGGAFQDTPIESIVLPSQVLQIYYSCFCRCLKLSEVTLPEGLVSIGSYAFEQCKNLTTIQLPNSLKEIGSNAFLDCGSLSSINYPTSLMEIGWNAFLGTSITSIEVPEGATKYVPLSGCELESITLPSTLKEIAPNAFEGNRFLKEFVIPEGVEKIGKAAFYNCSNLEEVVLPSTLVEMGKSVFSNCSELRCVHIPASVKQIDGGIFGGSSRLTSVVWDCALDVEDYSPDRNCLLYLTSRNGRTPAYGPNWPHVVIDGVCEELKLEGGASFYAPRPFIAKYVSYGFYLEDSYNPKYYTIQGLSRGWKALTLPYTPTSIFSQKKGTLAPFGSQIEGAKPFWMRRLTSEGWVDETTILPNKPYLVAFPMNPNLYPDDYNITGEVYFIGENVTIHATPTTLVGDEGPDYSLFPLYDYDRYGEYDHYVLKNGSINGEYQTGFFLRDAIDYVTAFSAYARPKEGVQAADVLPISPSTVKTGTTTRSVTGKRKPLKDDM